MGGNQIMELKIGTIIDSRYRVTGKIGHGGMADVYEAHDIVRKRIVAIKFIREDVMSNYKNIQRFENEARIAASLNHPNIIKVYDHGSYKNVPFIVHEYVPGQTLKEILDYRCPLTIPEAVDIMLQVTSALIYAHHKGIIHHDIKPQNIYQQPDGRVKLGDFGIAQIEDIGRDTRAKGDEIQGSVHYIAPEIVEGHKGKAQADIYSAGVTLFELVTGHVPFEGKTAIETAIAHVKEKFPSPKLYIQTCPDELERIIFKATKKKPSKRYKSALQFHEDLEKFKENYGKDQPGKQGFFSKLFGFK